MYKFTVLLLLFSLAVQSVILPSSKEIELKLEELERDLLKEPEEQFRINMKRFTYYGEMVRRANKKVNFIVIVNLICEQLAKELKSVSGHESCRYCTSPLYYRILFNPDYIERLFDILFEQESEENEKERALSHWEARYQLMNSPWRDPSSVSSDSDVISPLGDLLL